MYRYVHGGDIYSDPSLKCNKDMLDYSANINPLGIPAGVRRALREAIAGCVNYPDPFCRELRDRLSRYFSLPAEMFYCGNGAADVLFRLMTALQPKRTLVLAPTLADYEKAASQLRMAEGCLTDALTADNHSDILNAAGGVIYYTENAVALLNKRYFRKSVRRAYDELNAMPLRPANLTGLIESVVSAESDEALKESSLLLIREVRRCFHEVRLTFARAKREPDADALRGTYEEMFSNWRNKMFLAAQENNRHLAFMSMISMNAMLSGISEETETGGIDVLGGYNPSDLTKTAQSFDEALSHYRRLYKQAALPENRYPDIDAFIETYVQFLRDAAVGEGRGESD